MPFISDRSQVSGINLPTITYPNGREKIFTRTLTITWKAPVEPSPYFLPITYELYYTVDYNGDDSENWIQIASLPTHTSSFIWNIPFHIRSGRCRVGIRARDHRGYSSQLSISADNFTIQERNLS